MTKADIVEQIHQQSRSSRKDVAECVDLVFEKIKSTLEGGEAVKLSGFGNFIVHDKRARRGRNPQTGESITISSRKVLSFRPSQLLKAKVNR
ncbi:MAG: integration host factor subunit alpha [Candidatus Binatia bacterium]|jgi:integration host factor subunit alpha|nr:integration host factor subunit alpha [Candidatus Binatia bacterium]MDG1960174.1 integration host factor subunit alpha [Candidatus Binatia bacterium]MDG2010635.1 integration host factor subunit alpha [Candidatus Binatia bacterium]HAC81136.1 integration host factor subunit alpha [Deltaproteobacteria bacterium]